MKPKNPNSAAIPQSARRPKPRKLFIVLALVLIAIIGVSASLYYHHQAQEQAYQADKARFAKVETDMKTAYDAMVNAAGVPDVSKQDKGCGRPNLKYASGSLFCNITYTFAYGEDNLNSAYLHTKALQGAAVQIGHGITSRSTADNILENKTQSLSIGLAEENGFTCSLDFNYGNPQYFEGFRTIDKKYFSLYQFRCTKGVIKGVY